MAAPISSFDSAEALVCVHPGELKLEARPRPVPGEGEVLVRPRRIGICGTDYHIYEGKHPFLDYPRVMGHELAVEVLEAPSGAHVEVGELCVVNPYLSCGECVTCRAGRPNACVKIEVLGVHRDGGMATILALPQKNLVKARGLTADECASVEFLSIGAHAVSRAQVSRGDRVLVVGAGPIGLGTALFSHLSGGAVSLLDIDRARLGMVGAMLGVHTIESEPEASGTAAWSKVHEAFDVVFDATGSARSMEQSFRFVAPGGRYVLVGVNKEKIAFEDPDFHRRELTLLASRNAVETDFERVIAAIRDGFVPTSSFVTHRTTLAGAAADLPVWATSKDGLVKGMIEV